MRMADYQLYFERAVGQVRTKTKYRGLSTAAAKCAASGRDDVSWR
jgi:hypothetical protein